MTTLDRTITSTTRYIKSDTVDGSTVFLDSSGNSFPITATGDTQHSTTQHKFGASSIKINNSSGSLGSGCPEYPVSIDFWIYLNNNPATTQLIIDSSNSEISTCHLDLSSSGVLSLVWLKNDASPLQVTLPLGEWAHVYIYAACDIVGTYHDSVYNNYTGTWTSAYWSYACTYNLKLAVNGSLMQKNFSTSALPIATDSISFSNFSGYLDDIFISGISVSSSFTPPTDAASDTNLNISGKVMEGTANVARIVRAYDRTTGELLGSTMSDATTGEYTISNLPASASMIYVICLDDDAGEDFEALIHDRVVPVGV